MRPSLRALIVVAVSAAATVGFAALTQDLRLDDAAFYAVLTAFSLAAGVVVAASALTLSPMRAHWFPASVAAVVLVPVLYAFYVVVLVVVVCPFAGCDLS